MRKFLINFVPLVVCLLVVFPAKPVRLEVAFFSGFVYCCPKKKVPIFNLCVLSKSLFKMRDSAGEFPAAP